MKTNFLFHITIYDFSWNNVTKKTNYLKVLFSQIHNLLEYTTNNLWTLVAEFKKSILNQTIYVRVYNINPRIFDSVSFNIASSTFSFSSFLLVFAQKKYWKVIISRLEFCATLNRWYPYTCIVVLKISKFENTNNSNKKNKKKIMCKTLC